MTISAESASDVVPDPESPWALDGNFLGGLPPEVFHFLVRCTPSRDLWKWLTNSSNAVLMQQILRGFQHTVHALRQNVVRNRLVLHLQQKPEAFAEVLKMWGAARPTPTALSAVRATLAQNEAPDAAILGGLWQEHSGEALVAALLHEDRADLIAGLGDDAGAPSPEPSPAAPTLVPSPGRAAPTPEVEAARAETRRLQQEAARQAQHAAAQKQKTQAAEKALRAKLEHEKQRAAAFESQLEETTRLYDRTARKLRSLEREFAELTTEDKRMKRLLRRQQQLNEELRKQLAAATPPAETVAPRATKPTTPAPTKTLANPKVQSPLDQHFIWRSDGRPFNVTPRQVKKGIDSNDEPFIFRLIQAFDALRADNENGYRMFLDRIREFDRYYGRVLTVDTTRVLVDASNVARYEKDKRGKGQLRHLLAMREELRRRDCFPIAIYADASLPYHIDEPEELQRMVKAGEIVLTVAGQEADELLAREARRTGAYVVTNDRTFHTKVSPDFEPPRITFRIHDGFLIVDDF